MNKLEGFFELKKISVPTVEWKLYREGDMLSKDMLWTVRTAVTFGDDFNLPRLVGAPGDEAERFAQSAAKQIGEDGMVVYYPFFVAEASGTVRASLTETVIECVKGDLWNLVTHGDMGYGVVFGGGSKREYGTPLLSADDVFLIQANAERLKKTYREALALGKSVYAEWSFAFNAGADGKPIGERFLVFYELRIVD